jgi:hypothetical protein
MEIAPINFCSKIAFNLRNENYKNKILKELFDRYKIMVTENSCSIYDKRYSRVIVNQFNDPFHILSTNTTGNRYYLYFCRDEFDKNMCLFIDRKICRGYTQPRVIYTNFKMDNDIFDGTLIHGELVKVNVNKDEWFFILNDIISYCGKSLKHTKKLDRIHYMYKFLQKQYSSDDILDVCKFQVKKFFTYRQLDEFMNYVKTLPYQVNGILFNSLNPSKMDILLLHNMETAFNFKRKDKYHPDNKTQNNKTQNNKTQNNIQNKILSPYPNAVAHTDTTYPIQHKYREANKHPTPRSIVKPEQHKNKNKNKNKISTQLTDTFAFYITKIEGGIFQLISYVNKNEKVFGNARINKMNTQIMVEHILGNEDKVLIECKYNAKFNKFVPCGKPKEGVNEPSQYLDVTRYVESL